MFQENQIETKGKKKIAPLSLTNSKQPNFSVWVYVTEIETEDKNRTSVVG